MTRVPTKQQRDLQKSCPHQNWIDIDLADYDYCVQISDICPGSPEFRCSFSGASDQRHNRPTPALREAWEYAKGEQKRGAKVVKDFAFGVHQVNFGGGEIQYIFVEYEKKLEIGSGEVNPPRSFEGEDLDSTVVLKIEKRMLKVLKAVTELEDSSLSVLIEHIISQSVKGREVFSEETLLAIKAFRQIYKVSDDVLPQQPQGAEE